LHHEHNIKGLVAGGFSFDEGVMENIPIANCIARETSGRQIISIPGCLVATWAISGLSVETTVLSTQGSWDISSVV